MIDIIDIITKCAPLVTQIIDAGLNIYNTISDSYDKAHAENGIVINPLDLVSPEQKSVNTTFRPTIIPIGEAINKANRTTHKTTNMIQPVVKNEYDIADSKEYSYNFTYRK